jgi:glycosyltransferase involved in cell wall biosynthesis
MLADVVVSASIEPEAFGRVAVEAQAMGRPVIATDLGAARETVVPGETGWLVPPGDVGAMSEALHQALALDTAAREEMAERAMRHVQTKYTKMLMCARTIDLYNQLLAEAGTDAAA